MGVPVGGCNINNLAQLFALPLYSCAVSGRMSVTCTRRFSSRWNQVMDAPLSRRKSVRTSALPCGALKNDPIQPATRAGRR